jgi:hypothetical protein
MRNWHAATGDWKEWRWILVEDEVHIEPWCLRRRRGEGGGGEGEDSR